MILAGDVGGTKVNLALFERRARGSVGPATDAESMPGARYPTFEALLEDYRSRHPGAVTAASFGVAGAVTENGVFGTNLPWAVDANAAARTLGLDRVRLVNDLVATGYGIPTLDPSDLAVLQAGRPSPGANAGLIAAGTGLGESIVVSLAGEQLPIPSEGGHADFAPRTDDEIDLLRTLRARFGRVSYERVLSGPGLASVAEWTHLKRGAADAWDRHRAAAPGDALPGEVSREGLAGTCPHCLEALERFASAYGAEAGNLALRGMTLAGIYLAGGIAPKILPVLKGDGFRNAFREKEPHREMLAAVPVWVVLNERTAVQGAARLAALAP